MRNRRCQFPSLHVAHSALYVPPQLLAILSMVRKGFALLLFALMGQPYLVAASVDLEIDFRRDVRPILSEYCFHCHGPDVATREAGLRLDTPESLNRILRAELDSGSRVDLDKGNARQTGSLPNASTSLLGERLFSPSQDERMPPAESKQPTAPEREILRLWLRNGAEVTGHWSFEPVVRPAIPDIPDVQSPVDSFIVEKLLETGLSPVGPAEPRILLRRLSVAATGQLPSLEEITAFDNLVETAGLRLAAEQTLDRLMSSPAYGEHMAYSWLEAARYADTDGYQNDRYRYQDAWRDWVIRAFNEKKSYADFVTEQIAGDLLPNATLRQQVATGFGRNHRINSEDGSIEEEWRVENVVDRVDTFGTVFLGLTVGCARCHDHKYDPLAQKEYYELFAHFNNISEYGIGPNNGNTPPFIKLPEAWPRLSIAEDRAITPAPVKLSRARKEVGNGLRRPQPGKPGTVMVMHELDVPRDTFLLLRGQYNAPDKSQRLRPGVPAALSSKSEPPPENRLQLARWLLNQDNPLTARVAVNRLWQQAFGIGLVESSENFGAQGTLPSHPELLDWLATELMDSGWDTTHIQRLIFTSDAFARSSIATASGQAADPTNRLLWRGPKVRLTAAELRDASLMASEIAIRRIGGPSVKPYMPPKIWSSISNNKYEQSSGSGLFRRSLYTYWRRTIPPPTMVNFNAASRETCSVRNEITNTPLQALTLLNNRTFVEAARNLADTTIARRLKGASQAAKPLPKVKLPLQIQTEILQSMFQKFLTRDATANELSILQILYRESLREFSLEPNRASELLAIGDSPRIDHALSDQESAAFATVASAIMNLDEAIHRE